MAACNTGRDRIPQSHKTIVGTPAVTVSTPSAQRSSRRASARRRRSSAATAPSLRCQLAVSRQCRQQPVQVQFQTSPNMRYRIIAWSHETSSAQRDANETPPAINRITVARLTWLAPAKASLAAKYADPHWPVPPALQDRPTQRVIVSPTRFARLMLDYETPVRRVRPSTARTGNGDPGPGKTAPDWRGPRQGAKAKRIPPPSGPLCQKEPP